jgi:hypothetical protein
MWCPFDLASFRELGQMGRDLSGLQVQALSEIASGGSRVLDEEVDDARLPVGLSGARRQPRLAVLDPHHPLATARRADITAALADREARTARNIGSYEREHKDRAGVRGAVESHTAGK